MSNKVRTLLGNQEPVVQKESGSIVNTNANKNQGGFRPAPDKTVLGTMNNIMTDQYNKK
jgi:hypothetical protein